LISKYIATPQEEIEHEVRRFHITRK